MSTSADTAKAATVESVPESPTTARPLEMDDDDVQESGITSDDAAVATKPTAPGAGAGAGAGAGSTAPSSGAVDSGDVPPPKPPRPVSEQQRNEQTLREAFPTIDAAVVRAVLRASRGQVEPAFNALLEMTDPDAVQRDEQQYVAAAADDDDDRPPPPPPRPAAAPVGPTATPAEQLEADELYARRLAEHYENAGAYEARTANRGGGRGGRQQTGLKPNELYEDREHSFLDDDFPVIKESLKKGFIETQTKVNSWFNNLKKKIDEQFDEGGDDNNGQRPGGAQSAFAGRPTRNQSRRSAEYDRYDADPELLSDDFGGLKFNSDGTPIIPNQPSRANPSLYQPPPPSKSPRPSDGRRVAFNESVEDIDAYNASPRIPPKDNTPVASPGSAGKTSKWQPLTMVEPSPVAENDPFSLGDSDDERDTRDKAGATAAVPGGKKDAKDDDAERLRKAAAEAMADSLVEDDKPTSKA